MKNKGKYNDEHSIITPSLGRAVIDFVILSQYIQQGSASSQEMAAAGFTEEVIEGLLDGIYTKVINNAYREVWDYSATEWNNGLGIQLYQGGGFDVMNEYSLVRNNDTGVWTIIYSEI